jgi:hypothetical protein
MTHVALQMKSLLAVLAQRTWEGLIRGLDEGAWL